MGTAWLVRAGQESRHAAAFEAAGAIALGWTNIPGLNDLAGLSTARIAELVHAFGRAPLPAAQDAAELVAFRDELAVGDLVVTPDARVRQVLVGTVASAYRYDEGTAVGDYRHVRDVEWLGRMERDALREPLRKDTNYRRTLRRLDDNHDAWFDLAERIRTGEVVLAPRRALRATRAKAEKGFDTPTDRRCADCGLTLARSLFEPGSDLCNDCRERSVSMGR